MNGRLGQSVVWQQGTFMMPQHLQQQDAHHQACLAARLQGAAPRNVGLLQLEIDKFALQEGLIRLPSASVIMPQGEAVQWHSGQAACQVPQERALPHRDVEPSNIIDVYLVLPALRAEGGNVELGSTTSGRYRFVAHTASLPEYTQGQTPPTDVLLARPNIAIAFAHELQEGDCHLHILRVTRLPHGGAQVDHTFLPQSLRLRAMESLYARLKALKCAVQCSEQQARESVSQAPRLWARHCGLVQMRLSLSELLQDGYAAPLDVYRQLRHCLPWLVRFDPHCEPFEAFDQPFDDRQPGRALWPLVEALERAAAAHPVPVRTFATQQVAQSGLWMAQLQPWPEGPNNKWFVCLTLQEKNGQAFDAASRERQSQAWQRLAKIAAPSQMPRLIRSALRGLALTVVDTPPAALSCAPNSLVFALDTHDSAWPLVHTEGEVVLLPPPNGDALSQLTVMCLTAEGSAP